MADRQPSCRLSSVKTLPRRVAGCLFAVAAMLALGAPARAGGLTLSVFIIGRGEEGPQCQYYVIFNPRITNDTGENVTVLSVDYGVYNDPNTRVDGGLRPGTVLHPGDNSFNDGSVDDGYDTPCGSHPPPAFVLTVQTDHGTVVWDQGTAVPSGGAMGAVGVPLLAGSALAVAQIRRRRPAIL